MAIALSNTHLVVNRLKESGFTEKQAQAVTDAIQEVDLSGLATRHDLERGLERVKNELMVAVSNQTNTILRWMVALLIAFAALMITVVQLID